MHAVRSCALLVAVALALSVSAAKPAPAPQPPSAIIAGTWTSTGPFPEPFDFLPTKLSFQRTFTVPAGGAWLWGDAKYANYLEMDCDHHYEGTVNASLAEYTPLFTAGELPAPYDVCTFGNCYSCRLDWGGVKASSYLTTVSAPAFVPEGTRVITISTLNGGGNNDRLNLLIAQMNRSDLTSLTMFQALTDDDPSPASDTEVADRTFVANSEDRVPIVPVFHGSTGDFPGGPDVTYAATWDSGDVVTGDESQPKVLHGLTVVDVPIPKLTTGNHKFRLTATLPGGKTLTTPAMTVFVYAQTIFLTYGAFNAKTGTDDLPKFVPGVDANGANVDLRTGPQVMQLSIVTGRATGSVNVTIDPTYYPGIAMNYPIPAAVDQTTGNDVNPDMDCGLGQLTFDVPIPKDHVIRLPLYVRDYGGAATIKAVVPYRKKTYTARRRIPIDDDRNGLPDAGWPAQSGVHVSDAGLQATDDTDNQPANSGATGDGLSAFEEYRGFFEAGGNYVRLNPRSKDIFIDIDEPFLLQWNGLSMLQQLPVGAMHFLDPGQTKAVDWPDRVERASGEIDPNRAGVPGAPVLGQRAIRVVYQDQHPGVYDDPVNGTSYAVWRVNLVGITLPDEFVDVYKFNSTANRGPNHSPNHNQFTEIYPAAFTNFALRTAFNRTYTDAAGTPVPDCATVSNPDAMVCDDQKMVNNKLALIVPHPRPVASIGLELRDLYTVLDPSYSNEFYSAYVKTCGGLAENFASQSLMTTMRMASLGHEIGHAVRMEHTSDCGNIMFTGSTQSYINVVPIQTTYDQTLNIDRIRLFEP